VPAVNADSSGEEGGLLGKLPRSRPAVETPTRAAARDAAEPRRSEPLAEPESGPAQTGSGFERLARAGAGLAGGAAAAGFRLAGRAVGEIGKAVGRG
jgi:hypothetical protein